MAITQVAVGAAPTPAATGNLVVSYPAGLQTDDVLILHAWSRDNVALTLPAGWTIKAAHNNGTTLRQTIAWKRRAAGDSDTNVTLTHAGGDVLNGRILVLRGATTTGDPFQAIGGPTNYAAATSGTRTMPTVTTTTPSAQLLYFVAAADDYATGYAVANAQSLTVTEWNDVETTTGLDSSGAAYHARKATAGAQTGIGVSFTLSASAVSVGWAGALTPAPITVTAGQPAQTDIPGAITPSKIRTVGQVAEADTVQAVTSPSKYYVDPAGSDTFDGLTPGTAWRTLSKVSGVSFPANSSVFFKRGARWKETLTIPASGLRFGAYGADPIFDSEGYCTNAPIIDGGEFLTGWSAYSGGAETRYNADTFATGTAGQTIDARAPELGTWTRLGKFASTSNLITTAAGRARRGGTTTVTMYYEGPGPASADYYAQAPVFYASAVTSDAAYVTARQDLSNGNNEVFYAAVMTASVVKITRFSVSPASADLASTPFTPVVGSTYTMRLEVQGTTLRLYIDGVLKVTTADANLTDAGVAGLRLGGTGIAAQTDTTGFQFDSFETGPLGATGSPVNTYQATLAAKPGLVDFRSTYSHQGVGPDSLLDGQWYWVAGKLYARSDVGAVTNTDVVIGTRTSCVVGSTRASTTLEDIAFEHASRVAVAFTGAANVTINRCYAQRTSVTYQNGQTLGIQGVFSFIGASPDAIVDSCVVRHVGTETCYFQGLRPTVTNCRLGPSYEWGSDIIQCDSAAGPGTTVTGQITNNYMTQAGSDTIKGCVILFGDGYTVADNYLSNANWGVIVDGNNTTIARNMIYRCTGGGVKIDDHTPGEAMANITIDHNVIVDCTPAGLWIKSAGTAARTNVKVYANTIVNTVIAPTWAVMIETSTSGEFKDNIVWNPAGGGTYKFSTGTWASDYNDLGPQAANFVSYGGTLYATLAAYSTGKTQDTHSITGNPLLHNPSSDAEDKSGQRPAWGSPIVGAGTTIPGFVTLANIGAMDPAPASVFETDTAMPIIRPHILQIGQVIEALEAMAVSGRKRTTIGQPEDIADSFAFLAPVVKSLNVVLENELALPVGVDHVPSTAPAERVDPIDVSAAGGEMMELAGRSSAAIEVG